MKVDKKLVEKVAGLAKLEFDEAAKEKMVSDMDKIISFINKLEELDTESIEPLVYMSKKRMCCVQIKLVNTVQKKRH